MDTDRGFRSERTSISHNPIIFSSVGGHLARNIAPSEINSTENGTPRHNNDFTQSFIRMKNEFLPFLNERDGMNRIISSVPSKYDPSKLSEPSNPSLYYKSDRFNLVRLRFDQAERNRKSLSKLLQFKSDESNKSNILEADKATRLHKAAAGKSLFSKNTTKWFGFESGAQDDQHTEFLSSDRYAINLDLLEPEALMKNTPSHGGLITPCLLQNLNEMKIKKKNNMLGMLKIDIPGNKVQKPRIVKSRSEIFQKKKLTLPNDDFCGFFTQIDNDLRNMETSSLPLRQKTRRNIISLEGVMKRFEVPKPPLKPRQGKLKKLVIVSPANSQVGQSLLTKDFSTIPTPRQGNLHKRSQSDKGIIYSHPKVYKEERRKKFIL